MSISQSVQKLLVLAPHTDDGEIGAGGLISTFANAGVDIYYTAFSSCEESVPNDLPEDRLITECKRATHFLGLKTNNVTIKNYRVRRFNESRQDILEDLISLRNSLQPDWVLAPSSHDTHQDHSIISMEALRAFKDRTLLGYELPWNCIDFKSNFIFQLTTQAIETKIGAIQCYESQSFRGYGNGQPLKNLAELRGSQIGAKFGEAFEVMRWVWRQ